MFVNLAAHAATSLWLPFTPGVIRNIPIKH